jgi:hypothetical protein
MRGMKKVKKMRMQSSQDQGSQGRSLIPLMRRLMHQQKRMNMRPLPAALRMSYI